MLSVKETAEVLGISQNLVYSLIAKKLIRHERHGLGRGVIRIPEDALEEYRRGQTIDTKGEKKAEHVNPASSRPLILKHIKA